MDPAPLARKEQDQYFPRTDRTSQLNNIYVVTVGEVSDKGI